MADKLTELILGCSAYLGRHFDIVWREHIIRMQMVDRDCAVLQAAPASVIKPGQANWPYDVKMTMYANVDIPATVVFSVRRFELETVDGVICLFSAIDKAFNKAEVRAEQESVETTYFKLAQQFPMWEFEMEPNYVIVARERY